jgi:murein L,D-transpeptidase YafK
MKKIPVMIGSLTAACTAFLVFLSFFLFYHPKNMDLPKLTNPRIVITKAERELVVFDGDKFIKAYKMVLGFKPAGDKEIEGDGKTPEGKFYVFTKNTESKFHLSLGVSYPGLEDAKRGLEAKLISQEEYDEIASALNEKRMPLQKTKLGGEIYIHGGGTESDWTDGCVALANEEITELFEAIPVGTEVEIRP